MSRFEPHSHSDYSNLRLVDCINKVDVLINRAVENGLSGIALTDHETLSGIPTAKKIEEKIQEKNPSFKVAIGNEIYLTETREKKQKYYHFILIAKDAIGWRMLKELSSLAWLQSYSDRGMERVPTLKSELEESINKFGKGHLIATSSCLGGELSTLTLQLCKLEKAESAIEEVNEVKQQIHNFISFCLKLFEKDFYIECAPGRSSEQLAVNERLQTIAKGYNIKMVIGTDAHYPTKETRYVHKAYLNSKDGEREIDSFYEYSYLQTEEEIQSNLEIDNYLEMVATSEEIYNKIENFSIWHTQQIPEVKVKHYEKQNIFKEYPILNHLFLSDDEHDRYWANQCIEKLKEKNILNQTYLSRLEEEADTKQFIGNKLKTNLFSYPITLQHYINLFWECGSAIGAGRGSSCAGLNHYLLGVTQVDPIKEDLPWFRYLNKDRVELPDIDIDLCPSKRPLILSKIKEERGKNFDKNTKEIFKENLGCTLVATFSTEKAKSCILTAARGYRTEEYPEGIDVDEALYLASLIPQERGQLWTLSEVINGNLEKDRKPVKTFINEINKFPGLLEIVQGIEGLIKQRGSHASGVILFNQDPFEFGAFMKTPSGDVITQFDLHDDEALGMTKFDFLLTDIQDKIVETVHLLQKDNQIDPSFSLKEVYDKYLHPDVLPLKDEKLWKALDSGKILNVFQFDSPIGAEAIKKIQPKDIFELSSANGLMRLMTNEKGQETPMDKYIRFKKNPQYWKLEMQSFHLTEEEQNVFSKYIGGTNGIGISQEQLMKGLMDPNICNFSLADANAARKTIAKKKMDQIPVLKEKIKTKAKNVNVGEYAWFALAVPSLGYSFSDIHARVYSYIGLQTVYLATYFNPIYWNTACLIVNSGSLEDNSKEEIVDIFEPEADDLANGVSFVDLPDRSAKIRKTSSTDYTKIAKAIGNIKSVGVEVYPVDINSSDFGFTPDVKNNRILFGLKALLNVGEDVIAATIANRPYVSPKDYLNRVKPKRQAMISLIKGGAFDEMMDRKLCMGWYIWETCDKKSRLTLQNMPGLLKYEIIPNENDKIIMGKRIYEFTRYLKSICKNDKITYILDERAIDFLTEIGCDKLISNENDIFYLKTKTWDTVYQKWMDIFRDWLSKNKEKALQELNSKIFKEDWDKYAKGNLSSWEMEVMCFYYHEHELAHINNSKYGVINYFKLPEEPIIERTFKKGEKEIKIFKLFKIVGTCIAKDKTRSTVFLLTPTGVVNVKFNKELFALYDKQISEKNADGTKKVMEKSWFNRGNMLMIQGVRSGDNFLPKKYANSGMPHRLYHIDSIDKDGFLTLRTERYNGNDND